MKSAIYSGTLLHSRLVPREHTFVYPLRMLFLNLDELESFFAKSKFWVMEKFGLVSFRRRDYLPDHNATVKEAVIDTIRQKTGKAPIGPIYMLSSLRYLGLQFNPASFFYCYDKTGDTLTHILIEVHNTPWSERHRYVLQLQKPDQKDFKFDKEFHVSPFNPMDMQYACFFTNPDERLSVRMENFKDGALHFRAFLKLKGEPLTADRMSSFARKAWRLPFKIAFGIYWQALKLFLKRVPIYNHPTR